MSFKAVLAFFEELIFCRIFFRTDDDEVIVHDQTPVQELSLRDVFFFQARRVDQGHIGIPLCGQSQCLAGPHGDRLDTVSGLFFK